MMRMTTEKRRALDLVYSAQTPTELHDAYSAWANEYDRETAELGYGLPFLIGAWVARYVPRGNGPILDAGCGTGLSGPYLKALGYDHIEGLDISAEMLRLARARNVYHTLKQGDLSGRLAWADGYFSAFLSTGVFTEGHAPASSLEELVRITERGGHAIFTVRDTVLKTGGFRDMFAKMEAARRWQPIEESPPFRAFAVGEPEVQVQAFVFEVL